MDFEGNSISTQGQVDDLNARVTELEAQVVIINQEITDINTVIGGLLLKIDTLSESAIGNFTPFTFTSTSLLNLNFYGPITVIGNALFIPYSHMASGMCIRYTVWTAIQNTPAQDFRMFLSQNNIGTLPYTSTNYESCPDTAAATINRKYTFTVLIKDKGAASFGSVPVVTGVTEISSGFLDYTTPTMYSFYDNGGMGFFLMAQWATLTGLQNFAVSNLLIERTSGFL